MSTPSAQSTGSAGRLIFQITIIADRIVFLTQSYGVWDIAFACENKPAAKRSEFRTLQSFEDGVEIHPRTYSESAPRYRINKNAWKVATALGSRHGYVLPHGGLGRPAQQTDSQLSLLMTLSKAVKQPPVTTSKHTLWKEYTAEKDRTGQLMWHRIVSLFDFKNVTKKLST